MFERGGVGENGRSGGQGERADGSPRERGSGNDFLGGKVLWDMLHRIPATMEYGGSLSKTFVVLEERKIPEAVSKGNPVISQIHDIMAEVRLCGSSYLIEDFAEKGKEHVTMCSIFTTQDKAHFCIYNFKSIPSLPAGPI